jgi:hypothetical protein
MLKRYSMLLIIGLLMFTSACQPTPPAVATIAQPVEPTATAVPSISTPIPPTATAAAPVLDIVGADGNVVKSLSLDEIKALPSVEGQAGIKSSTGKVTPPATFKGVTLKDLAALAGNFDPTMGVNLIAKDGYSITFSYDQITKGTFVSYDPGTGDELKSPDPLTAILAYEMNGQPLNLETDGNLRLVIISEKNNQVTDGHWSVKWVTKLEVKSLSKEWSLHMEGTINELMDRATFESGASPNCHGVTWKDDKAQDWVGIPLWLLVGRVDDSIKHDGPAFNDALADAGYTVDVVASDGYTATFESSRIKRNNNIIVAHLVNGNPLPDKYFPLRLVGSDLQKNEMVGMISKIILKLSPAAAAIAAVTPTAEAVSTPAATTGQAELTITGLVEKELLLKEADLRAMDVVKITADSPKKGKQDYEGVRLSTLLEKAKVNPEAKKLVLIAADGYKAEVFLSEVQSCADCMVAFTDTPGKFYLVMPGLPGNVWIKEIFKIEVQ